MRIREEPFISSIHKLTIHNWLQFSADLQYIEALLCHIITYELFDLKMIGGVLIILNNMICCSLYVLSVRFGIPVNSADGYKTCTLQNYRHPRRRK